MHKNTKRGWYTVINTGKVMKPIDQHMGSFRINEDKIQLEYKSSLELKAIKYCDFNKHIVKYAVEPFAIKYVKPSDGKVHRYYIDLFIEFSTSDKFLVEIKPKSETIPPKKPSKNTNKSVANYQRSLLTFAINQAKWKAAEEFAKLNKMRFIILTEEELK